MNAGLAFEVRLWGKGSSKQKQKQSVSISVTDKYMSGKGICGADGDEGEEDRARRGATFG